MSNSSNSTSATGANPSTRKDGAILQFQGGGDYAAMEAQIIKAMREQGTSRCRITITRAYEYGSALPASSIRILQLQPATEINDPLCCRIIETKLASAPAYKALSYVWGSDVKPCKITCDGGRTLPITTNLDAALRNLRSENDELLLWADSVCINQKDVDEVNTQVRMMGDIYRNASCVAIWLGDWEDYGNWDVEKAFNYLTFLLKDMPFFEEVRDAQGPISFGDGARLKVHMIAQQHEADFGEFEKLFRRPWFSRAWTYQESAVAKEKEFYCGPVKIPGIAIQTVVDRVLTIYKATGNNMYSSFYDTRIQSMFFHGFYQMGYDWKELDDLLNLRSGGGSSKPSDIVYSLIGVSTDYWRSVIHPDYRKPFQEVYAETMIEIIRKRGNLNILSAIHLTARYQKSPELPSWTPDWRQYHEPCFRLTHSGTKSEDFRTFAASGSSKPKAALNLDPLQLTLHGVVLDTISDKATQPSLVGHWRWVTENLLAGVLPKTYKFTGEPIDEVLIKVTSNDMTQDKKRFDSASMSALHKEIEDYGSAYALPPWRPTDPYHILDMSKVLNLRPGLTAPSRSKTLYLGDKTSTGIVITEFHSGYPDAYLMMTHRGIIGTISSVAEPGDVIMVPVGGQVPIVLRPVGDKFTFQGECYCHGFMDGEAFIEARRKVDKTFDGDDVSWLERLHEESILFPMDEFVLV
ncbi:heterokaryon incompatibility protein-domain-containing protein [Hyaloscypha sp. PMI_1271]|nr:heterokaryon incompatibility protein-domain-containing protein [Hyaloscypha sp. PMI_1271]